MNAIKQVSKNPFQPVHTVVLRSARTAPYHDLPECHLLTGMRLTGGTLAATANDIVFRSALPLRRHHRSCIPAGDGERRLCGKSHRAEGWGCRSDPAAIEMPLS